MGLQEVVGRFVRGKPKKKNKNKTNGPKIVENQEKLTNLLILLLSIGGCGSMPSFGEDFAWSCCSSIDCFGFCSR